MVQEREVGLDLLTKKSMMKTGKSVLVKRKPKKGKLKKLKEIKNERSENY